MSAVSILPAVGTRIYYKRQKAVPLNGSRAIPSLKRNFTETVLVNKVFRLDYPADKDHISSFELLSQS